MKRKNFRSKLASLVVFLLVGVMGVTAAVTSLNGKNNGDPIISTNSAIQAGRFDSDISSALDPDKIIDAPIIGKSEKVSLIVELSDTSLIDMYLADSKGYATFSEYRVSPEGIEAAEALIKKQNAVYNKIARQADVKLKYNYVNVMNGFAIEITYGDRDVIDKIAYKANVFNTIVGERYEAPETQEAISVVENHVSALETGIFDSSASIDDGFAGQGLVVGVLDTGLDFEHIAFEPENPLFDVENQRKNNTLRFTEDYIKNLVEGKDEYGLPMLAASALSDTLTVDDVYQNEKVPFTYDYADDDPIVNTSIENSHGTHVAGIIAGHSDTPRKVISGEKAGEIYLREVTYAKEADGKTKRNDNGEPEVQEVKYYQRVNGERVYDNDLHDEDLEDIIDEKTKKQITGITGVAPAAQLAIFKVFSDKRDVGAESSFLLAALEDCITLDVDAINMSLGAECGFQDEEDAKDSIFNVYRRLEDTGISVVVAASNSFSSGFNSHYGLNLISNPDAGTIGSPASYNAAFTVASISGVKSRYLLAGDGASTEFGAAYYYESATLAGEYCDFIEDLKKAISALDANTQNSIKQSDGSYRIAYATVPGVGELSDYSGINVRNKIALVKRGDINFEDKVKNARSMGALACIVYNNAAGMLHMQLGDAVLGFPTCAITMDAADNMKNKDTQGPAYMTINESFEGGPFISDFSSWGPLPNLSLKPEITAHGGEIYSSIPGDETAYSRLSGTSMACPNSAGVVLIMRQYLQNPENEYATAKAFGIWDEENEKIDRNLLERRVYQLLMSTATLAHNEQDNPYSPRKQGAGLADLERSRASKQYLYVTAKDEKGNEVEQERTKVELYDDPNRDGVYDITFYVKNTDTAPVSYKLSSYVMTEGISSDGKTVNEMSHVFKANDEYTVEIKTGEDGTAVTDGAITVEAQKELKISYTVTLGQSARDWLAKFPNGMYVEGFVCLENQQEGGINLNIPYLAFYGDWGEAPIMDYDVYQTSKDDNDDTIPEDDKRYAGAQPLMLIGKLIQEGSEYSLGMGQYPFTIPDEYEGETPDATADKCAITFDTDSGMCGLYGVGGFLRGAKRLIWQISDALTGEVISNGVYSCARKANGSGSVGGAWLELDIGDMKVRNNVRYNMEIYPVIDWKEDDYVVYSLDEYNRKVYDVQASIDKIVAANEAYNTANPEKARRYYWSSDFWVDTDAPFISNVGVNVVRNSNDDATYLLNIDVTDNHYAMGLGLRYYDKTQQKFVTYFSEEGLRPFNGERNSTTRMQFNIGDIWEQIQDGLIYRKTHNVQQIADNPELGTYLNTFQIEIYDYAYNRSYYTIDLYDIMENLTGVSFGDIGNYSKYTKPGTDESVNLLISTNNEVATDASGNPRNLENLTIFEGQRVDLMRAVVASPATAWREDFHFTVTDPNVLQLDEEKGSIYAIGAGNSTVRISSRTNASVYADLNVQVLSKEEAIEYGINVDRLQSSQSVTKIGFTENYKIFNAGEKYMLEFEPDPWYLDIDLDQYEIKWSVSNSLAANVEPLKEDPADPDYKYKAWVTASDGSYDENGNYVKNYSVLPDSELPEYVYVEIFEKRADGTLSSSPRYATSFPFYVLEEFHVEGSELKEYHGTPNDLDENGEPVEGRVVIPDNLNIVTVGNNAFFKNDFITEIKFPHNMTTVGFAACAYMTNLRKVELPDTLEKIDSYAFAAYNVAGGDGPETVLSVVDFSKCAKPIQVAPQAFILQRYIGVDLEQSHIVDRGDDTNRQNTIVLLKDFDKVFDLKMVRVVGEYAFYGLNFVEKVDLSGLRSTDTAAFYGLGSGLHKYLGDDHYATVTFGENSAAGLGAFVGSGIGEVVLPMRRISSQMFFGETYENGVDELGEPVYDPVYNGELKKITFTADNLVIEELAFMDSSVKEVVFEGSVKSIGDYAFAFSKLETVTFEDGCEKIGTQSFTNTNLKEIELPKNLTTLGNGAFVGCAQLAKVTIDEECKLTELGIAHSFVSENVQPAVFEGCTSLESFEVDADNANFSEKDGVLYNKDGSKIISVPCAKEIGDASELLNGVSEIGSGAFNSNASLTTIDLSDIEKIGAGAFFACQNLVSAKLPTSLTKIPDEIFYGCTSLTDVNIEALTGLKEIGEFAFTSTAIPTIKIPDSVNKIDRFAFATNEELTEITLNRNIKRIEMGTFYNCTKLEKVDVTIYVEYVGEQSFAYSAIKSINLPRCKEIAANAFTMCADLATVTTGASLETIGDQAFAIYPIMDSEAAGGFTANGSLETINLAYVKNIGARAFMFQPKLASVNLASAEVIGDSAFMYCENLTEIGSTLNALRRIESNAFTGTAVTMIYRSQSYVTLPDTLEYIDPSAFAQSQATYFTVGVNNTHYFASEGVLYRYLYDIEDLTIKDEDKTYELVAYPAYKGDAMEYTILDGTVRIAPYSFYTSEYLVRVNIPASVQTIGNSAFYGSSVKLYNFNTLQAPELEALSETVTTEYNDIYFWQVYDNFYMPFSYSQSAPGFKYNPVRIKAEDDVLVNNANGDGVLQNESYLGEGFNAYYYGIMISRPKNAQGFDTFVWSHYFDSTLLTPELIESATEEVMELIRALPEVNSITLAHKNQIDIARGRFDSLRSDEQRAFVRDAGLVDILEDCEEKLASLENNATNAVEKVRDQIDALPLPSEITLDDESKVVAAREAYNALSAENKTTFDTNYKSALDKLAECEARISELKKGSDGKSGCGSCGTVAFGNGGGTGLMIGLGVIMLACLVTVLLRKKRPSSEK